MTSDLPLYGIHVIPTERAKSPPLTHQDEVDELSTEGSSECADVSILEDFSATGDFRPGICSVKCDHNWVMCS